LNAAKEKLEIVSGAAPLPFRIFAGGLPRSELVEERNAFGLIQEYRTNKKEGFKAFFFGAIIRQSPNLF